MRVQSTPLTSSYAQLSLWDAQKQRKPKGRGQFHPCKICEKPVWRTPSQLLGQVFCGKDCWLVVHQTGEERPCHRCGKSVWRKGSDLLKKKRVFCSSECFPVRQEYQCPVCEKSFFRSPSQLFQRMFCGRQCAAVGMTGQPSIVPSKKVVVSCAACGTSSQVVPSKVRPRNFCNRECMGDWLRQNFAGRRPRDPDKCGVSGDLLASLYIEQGLSMEEIGRALHKSSGSISYYMRRFGISPRSPRTGPNRVVGRITKRCVDCDFPFTLYASQASARSRCPRCVGNNRWGIKVSRKVNVTCEECGKVFVLTKCHVKDKSRVFCNRRCQAEWRRKHVVGPSHPSWRGGRKASQKRKEANPRWRLCARISNRIRASLRDGKQGRHWEELVGFTIDDLMAHLQPKLKDGMTWANYGKWHLDHIRPVASFSFATADDPEFRQCWALSNLQPLWAIDNIRKGAKWIDAPVET